MSGDMHGDGPPAEQLPFGLSRETAIVRTADGHWFNEGAPIENQKLARAFDRWVTRAEDGRYCLKNDINWAYFKLEGAPFFVRAVRRSGDRVSLLLSNDQEVPLIPESVREGTDGFLYCDAYPGQAARFDSHAAVQLGEVFEEDAEGPFLRQGEQRVRPPRVESPLESLSHDP
jgi:hypothetical protein